MGSSTSIAWTNRTFNPWWGCVKIGPGCDNCYAAAFDHRLGGDHWGTGVERRYFGDAHWNEPLKWNKEAMRLGKRVLVFCASMADVFDNEVDQALRERLWKLIKATPALTWQIVTKRVGNVVKMLPADWMGGYPNVWLLITVVNQEEADRDIVKLLGIPARVHGLSVEPQLGSIDLTMIRAPFWARTQAMNVLTGTHNPSLAGMVPQETISWVISGGESGGKSRPFNIEWARSLRDQCRSAEVAFFLKQLGNKPIGAKATGKGEDPDEWPEDLRVREFPDEPKGLFR